MSTLAEFMILSGADNRPPMLKKHLTKRYEELSATKKIQADCDLKETNIILQGLPSDVYSLVSYHRVAKDLWEIVQLLMQVSTTGEDYRKYYKSILLLVVKLLLLVLVTTARRVTAVSYKGKGSKTLMEAIEKRFGGNKESKKTQKILLKQQYKNFNGSSSEGLDQTYDRLQKLISQLEIMGETLSQEDMNLNFLRSLPS
ncbi:hypothetical protein Tco_0073275 [Tanacetum coccineum]